MRTVVKTASGYTAVLDQSHPKISKEGGVQVFDDRFEVPIATYKPEVWAEVHVLAESDQEEPVEDRSDEIRAGVERARRKGWAAQLQQAVDRLRVDKDCDVARAIIQGVTREMDPLA